jgi:hypothetical protein
MPEVLQLLEVHRIHELPSHKKMQHQEDQVDQQEGWLLLLKKQTKQRTQAGI